MAIRCLVLLTSLFSSGPAAARADDDDKKKAELKWARGVADDLLAALKRGDEVGAEALLTGEYAKLLTARDTFKQGAGGLLLDRLRGFEKASIDSEEIAPDRDEAQFKGALGYSSETRPVVVRVVKDKESGRWRVAFVLVGEKLPPAKKEPKK